MHRELRGQGLTRVLLWQESKAPYPEGRPYSPFCEHYRREVGTLALVLRPAPRAGEKGFLDEAGQRVPVVDSPTGEVREAPVFVATRGASNEASCRQARPEGLASPSRALESFGAVPALLVPDPLKSAVARACRYAPAPHASYQELAPYSGTALLPARGRWPRRRRPGVERGILARLRHPTFFSLPELNAALRTLLQELHTRPFKKPPGSRRPLFETWDTPALPPLPPARYGLAEGRGARVHLNYPIEVDGHDYSVPYARVKQRVEVRLTVTPVEVFHRGQRLKPSALLTPWPAPHAPGAPQRRRLMPRGPRRGWCTGPRDAAPPAPQRRS